MKIVVNQGNLKDIVYKNAYYSIMCTQEHIVLEGTRYTAVVEGVIYRIHNKLCRHMSMADIVKELTALLSKSMDTFTSHLEGMYVIAVNDNENNILYIFRSDAVSYDLYYKPGTRKYVVSSDMKDLSENSLLDNNGIACILTEGYCPDRHTQYKGVYRLATDEYLLIKKDGLEKNKKHPSPLKIDENMKLERYCDTLKTAILSRASNTSNWVETSGGWDSATILGTLRTYNCNNIHAITVSVVLSDGLNFNMYEVSKSQELAKYYNVPLTIVEFNLNDDTLLHTFHRNLEVIKNQHIFDTQSLWKPVMYDIVNGKGEEGSVCFNGLFSDSIHNFGFSQYLTLIDNSTVFREFADKMATYLYSPSFFRKILNGSHLNDFIYRMFHWHNRVKDGDIYEMHSQMDKMNKYLLSFIYGRYRTVPFSKPFVSEYMTESGRQEFEYFLIDNYILPLAELLNDETVYFVFLELYKHFYLQGCEQKQVLYGLDCNRVNPVIPFLDGDLLNLMAQAPEGWGRGVCNWNNTKYPLKKYAESQIDFDDEILSSPGCHAYIYENSAHRNVNLNNELMYRSVFASELFDSIEPKMIENYFDDKYFDTDKLKGLIVNRSDCSSFKKRLLMYLTVMDAA